METPGTPRRRPFTTSTVVRSDAELSLPENTRHVLRHLANSVVVCTAHARDASKIAESADEAEAEAVPVGLTMSSFTSLSLYPTPVVTFNIAVPSRTEAALAKSRHFMVHVLSGDAKGARVADVFRTGNAHPSSTLHELKRSECNIVWPSPTSPSSSTQGQHRGSEQPFLQGPGVLYVLRCRLLDEPLMGLVPVRDHIVVLGEVLEIVAGEAEAIDNDGLPRFGLLYADRNYRQPDGVTIPSHADAKP